MPKHDAAPLSPNLLRRSHLEQGTPVAFAWYERADWHAIKAMSSGMDDTFEEWLASAEEAFADLIKQGFNLEKVFLKPSDFPKRMRLLGRKIDGSTRSKTVANKLQRQYNSSEIKLDED